jgi:hypothetical protein
MMRKKLLESIHKLNSAKRKTESFFIEESNMTDRFHFDINQKPFMDERKIMNELQNKRILMESKKDSSFFLVVNKTPLEIVDDISGPCSSLRKTFGKMRVHTSAFANMIIGSKHFETASIIVIVANSLSIALDDPKAITQTEF